MELKLIGNATNDHIYMDGELILERPGGVMNVRRALDIECELFTKEYHEANIQLGSNGEKYSKVDWGVDDWRGFKFPNSYWTHISYLDHVLVDMDQLNTTIISVDICDTSYSPKEIQFLENQLIAVDLLFIGPPELEALGGDLDQLIMDIRGTIILRERDKIICKRTPPLKETKVYPNTWITVPNTIGAGDTFVAEYLNHIGHQPCELGTIRKCVQKSVAYLRELNEI